MKNKLIMDLGSNEKDHHFLLEKTKNKNLVVNHYLVSVDNQKKYQRNKGDYYTIKFADFEKSEKQISKYLTKVLNDFFHKYQMKKTLVIGLGNSSIEADSLGVKTTAKIVATNHYNDFLTIPKIALFNPETTEKTGIDSFKLIELVVNSLQPSCLIIIDSLYTENFEHLNSVIEVSDAGIIPGEYLKSNKEINQNTFQIPIISIGIPLVIKTNHRFLTSPTVKTDLETFSNLIAKVLNKMLID